MNANVPKSGDNSTALSLVDVGPPREPAKLRILDDEGPLTIKARRPVADAKPRGGDWPFRMVPSGNDCHVTDVRNGKIIGVYRPGEVALAIRHMDDLNDQYREKEGVTGRDAPPPNIPPPNEPPFDESPRRDDTDLDPNISAALDVIAGSAVCECDERDEPCGGRATPCNDVQWPVSSLDRLEADMGREARERRAARQRALERLQDEVELVAEVGDLIREELRAEMRAELEQWRSRAIRRCLGACACVFVAGLAIGAILAHIL